MLSYLFLKSLSYNLYRDVFCSIDKDNSLSASATVIDASDQLPVKYAPYRSYQYSLDDYNVTPATDTACDVIASSYRRQPSSMTSYPVLMRASDDVDMYAPSSSSSTYRSAYKAVPGQPGLSRSPLPPPPPPATAAVCLSHHQSQQQQQQQYARCCCGTTTAAVGGVDVGQRLSLNGIDTGRGRGSIGGGGGADATLLPMQTTTLQCD